MKPLTQLNSMRQTAKDRRAWFCSIEPRRMEENGP
jgi:hypothetical protein